MNETYQVFRDYWKVHGGWKEILRSTYFRWSVVSTAFLAPLWLKEEWWELVISVSPSVIGFSLAAYAMIFAFGNDRFQTLMAHEVSQQEPSVFITVSAAFVHFIVVQMAGLLAAFFCKAWFLPAPQFIRNLFDSPSSFDLFISVTRVFFWGTGFLAFCYGLFCGLAATTRVFRLTRSYAHMLRGMAADEDQRPVSESRTQSQSPE